VRGLDTLARPVIRVGAAVPLTVLAEVRAKLSLLLGISERL
jgi:hypothetical protein